MQEFDARDADDPLDRLICGFDRALRAVCGGAQSAGRPSPADALSQAQLGERERRHSAGLMRVNHAGEVAAQALYHGQAMSARTEQLRRQLDQAAEEEGDHLVWCRQRLEQLDARTSRLDPLWYGGAFVLGAFAGLAGDRVSLGFLAETERQVVEHLEGHLARLPIQDARSRAVLEQMRSDEAAHATRAVAGGAAPLPGFVQKAMRFSARLMTGSAYWI